MINVDNKNYMDDFPELTPDKSIRFGLKDEIKRSSELDYECSELEYKCLVAAEDGLKAENKPLVEQYKKIRLRPDTNLIFPDKKSLKHKTFNLRLLWIPAAAAIAFVLIIMQNMSENSPVAVINSEEISNPAQNPVADIIPEPEIIPETKIKEAIPAKKIRKTTKKIVAVTAESDLSTETAEIKNDISRPEIAKLERIAAVSVAAEMMNVEKTVFVCKQNFRQNTVQKTVIDIVSIVEKSNIAKNIKELSIEIIDKKQNIAQILDGFRLTNILSNLNFDSGIDKHIDEWVENNKNVPFEVYINYFGENKMTEIFDENGTLVKVIFFTNKSLKYKNKKIYQVNNFKS